MDVLDKVRLALKTKLRVLKRKGNVVQIVCDEKWSKNVRTGRLRKSSGFPFVIVCNNQNHTPP